MILNSPRGTSDIFGSDIEYRNFIINNAKRLFSIFNYKELITPTFEHTQVFSRSIGDGTDIVQKEMYTFSDKKGRSLTLRPEGTASIVRAIIENKMYSGYLPVKVFYTGSMFRYERPQKGRMREFYQIGAEAVGTDNPIIDSEIIWLLETFFKNLGFKKLKLFINSMGCSRCRKEFVGKFKLFLEPKVDKLCTDCQKRYDLNPLRIFDCKKDNCINLISDSPKIYSSLCSDCKSHFKKVLYFLDALKIKYTVDSNLVRGFDYYTKTIFEFVSKDLQSAQNALGGGGRYDNLIQQFGGPDIPAIGFAVGVDRILMLMKQLNLEAGKEKDESKIYVIVLDGSCEEYSFDILKYLREKNYVCDLNYNIRALNSELKWAEKNGYDFAAIIGENEVKAGEVTIKDIKKRKQYKIKWDREKEKLDNLIRRAGDQANQAI